ncbi:MAG: hypothetical protein HOV97_16655, partial [Nonomuraea sp.]|nr:hypothetical protein [Nonomuraea sp.]
MIPSARADVHVTYRRMLIAEPGRDHPGAVPNGLTASAPGAAVILTGIHTGVVDVTVRLADTPPPADPGWDETEEVELVTFTGELRLSGMMASPTDALPLLTPQGPGRYGMRVQARGRPAGRQERPELPHPVRTTIRAADHRIRIVNPFQDTAPAPPLPDGLVAVAPDS